MTDYKPGTVALVTALNRTTPYRAVFDGDVWREIGADSFHLVSPTSVRPLVMLDLHDVHDFIAAAKALRHMAALCKRDVEGYSFAVAIADQIEAQTKLPRIPEPGLWGVVESGANGMGGHRGHFIRSESCNSAEWFCSKTRTYYRWADLIDPVLIREGVEA